MTSGDRMQKIFILGTALLAIFLRQWVIAILTTYIIPASKWKRRGRKAANCCENLWLCSLDRNSQDRLCHSRNTATSMQLTMRIVGDRADCQFRTVKANSRCLSQKDRHEILGSLWCPEASSCIMINLHFVISRGRALIKMIIWHFRF